MKILLRFQVAAWILSGSFASLGQGTVRFDNNVPGVVVTHVYGPKSWDFGAVHWGNGPNDYPPGLMNWGNGFANGGEFELLSGAGFSAQLFAAPGPLSAHREGLLPPASPITTFGTGPNAGFVLPAVVSLEGVPADAPIATVQLRVWDNQGGLLTDFWQGRGGINGVAVWGASPMFELRNIGGAVNPPPALAGLVSFNVAEFTWLPEPGTLTLAITGALILIHRRAKRQRPRPT